MAARSMEAQAAVTRPAAARMAVDFALPARSILQCALLHLRYLDDALVVPLKLPSPQDPTSHIRRRSAFPDSSYRYALNSRCLLHFALDTTLTNGTYAAAALSRNPHSISKTERTYHLTPYKHALPTSNGLSRGCPVHTKQNSSSTSHNPDRRRTHP